MKTFIFLSVICTMVALAVWFPQLMLNPGQLSEGHQKIKEQCTSCHQLFWGINDDKCILCHQPDQVGKSSKIAQKTQLLFHVNLKGQSCTSCHTDHKGLNPSLSTIAFNHKVLSATILANCNNCHTRPTDSLHAQLTVTCGSCHNTSKWQFSGTFNHDLITGINKTNCISCHLKPTDALHLSLQNNCVDCHSTSNWSPATFDHSSYFVLDEDHNVKCQTCHTNNNFKVYSCYGCHEHSEAKIAEEHNEEGIYQFDDCSSCHRSGDKHNIRLRRQDGNDQNFERIRKYVESERKKEDKKKCRDEDD